MTDQPPITLIACVKGKAPHPCAAREMYQSTWFKKAKAYAEGFYPQRWYILSAQYGLLHPDTPIEPYELTLNAMSAKDRSQWSLKVKGQITETIPPCKLVFLAGKRYREHLCLWLPIQGYEVEVPMQGLAIGFQQQWLGQQV